MRLRSRNCKHRTANAGKTRMAEIKELTLCNLSEIRALFVSEFTRAAVER